MTVPGSTLPAVRARLVQVLAGRLVDTAVGYHPPRHHVDVTAPMSGAYEAVWLHGEAETTAIDPRALGRPVRFQEEWQQDVIVQVLGRNTGDRQEDLDARVGDLTGEIMAELADAPDLGLAIDGWAAITVLPIGWRWVAGPLQRAGSTILGARAALQVQVKAQRYPR